MESVTPIRASTIGAWLVCISVTMIFAALTSAMVVRRATGGDWTAVPMPSLLWINTAILIVSSLILHTGWRRSAGILGFVFLAGQLAVWQQLPSAKPGDWFMWVLSVTHAVHLVGGLAALWLARIEAARIYWHFLTVLWIYLMLLLTFWGQP